VMCHWMFVICLPAMNLERINSGMSGHRDEFIPTRASLLHRLADWQDQASWQEFFDTYWTLIYSVARQAGLTEVEAQDAVQETLMSVAKHIPTFRYDPVIGSFKGWLLKMTRWRITDQLRKRKPEAVHNAPQEERTGTIDRVVDPASFELEKAWEVEWQHTLFEAAVEKIKHRVDPQKYQIFDFYVNKEWKPEKVAQAFGISVDQVYLAKHRVTELIKEEVHRLEKEIT
jgi:RNA polymerase sigma factor (sigma-70 family)